MSPLLDSAEVGCQCGPGRLLLVSCFFKRWDNGQKRSFEKGPADNKEGEKGDQAEKGATKGGSWQQWHNWRKFKFEGEREKGGKAADKEREKGDPENGEKGLQKSGNGEHGDEKGLHEKGLREIEPEEWELLAGETPKYILHKGEIDEKGEKGEKGLQS